VLEDLDQHAQSHGFLMPLDLGAKGSCCIGGNISTNAGGLRLIRYGSLHSNVLGLEVVLADGTVLSNLSGLRKDNTGYDLKQLFIGSEGTLGLVTAATLQLAVKPRAVNVVFLSCTSFERVQQVLRVAKSALGEILSAFEFLDADAMACVETHSHVKNPLDPASFYGMVLLVVVFLHSFQVLIETHGSREDHDREKVEDLLEVLSDQGLVEGGTIAQDEKQAKELWKIRESVPVAVKSEGAVYKYDISLPPSAFYPIVEELRLRLAGLSHRCMGYGHVGDGNLHINVGSREPPEVIVPILEPFVYEFTRAAKGSISAEHGIGLLKSKNLVRYRLSLVRA
jgi:D-2-hydroxyglutarate dehydrogenase